MEVDVSAAGAALLHPFDHASLGTVTFVDAPATTVGNASDPLHLDVHHVAGTFSDDPSSLAVRGTVRVDEPAPVEAKLQQDAGDRAMADTDALESEFELDVRR
ncbi:hypothetical protein FH975_02250 [Nesterenkonia sp. Hz 6-5]|nr:hypothetical protein [Nesterenkonia haasae]